MNERASSERAAPSHSRIALRSLRALLTALLYLTGATAVASSAAAGPSASLSAFRLDFAAQAVGTTSDPQTVTLTNAGDAPLTISDIVVNSLDFTLTNGSGPGTLAPGGSREIEIRYAPWNSGKRSALLTITSDAPNSPIAVGLFGADDTQPGPRVSMSPSFGELGFEPVGSNSITSVYVNNSGTAPLTIKSVTLAGADAGDFQIIEGGSPGIVQPGTYRYIRTQLHPTAPGGRNARLVIEDDAPGSPHTFVVFSSGAPVDPIRVTPGALDFGEQPEGTTSAAQTITLANTGTNPVNILGIVLDGGWARHFALVDSSPGPIAPGESRTLSVLFAPLPDGAPSEDVNARLAIAYDAIAGDAGALRIPLTGTHTATGVHLSPGLTFGSRRIGTSSDPQTITVTNTGQAPLAIVGLDLQGPDPAAYTVDPAGLGRILAPGAAANLSVTFAPTVPGPEIAALSLATNAITSPDRVSLTGMGVMPVLRLSPTALDFGPQPVGLNGTLGLLLQNTGSAPLTVSSVAFRGANAAEFSLATGGGSGETLQPGDITLLNVHFNPAVTGSRSASLMITDDAAGSPQLVALTGTGTAPLLTLSADSLVFGAQPASTTQTLILTNGGDAPLTVNGVGLAGPDASSFRIVSDSGEKSLDPGARRTLTIAFSPATIASRRGHAWGAAAHIAAVSYSATLEIRDNDPHPGAPHSVTLTAVETAPAAPTNLAATLTPADQVALTWTTNSSSETAFAIWRQTGSGAFVRVGVVAPKTTHFTDTGVRPNTAYTYEVRAINNAGASAWSNKATAVTLEAPPAAPANLTATVVSGGEIDLTWTRGGGDETGIAIFRRTGTGGWQRIGVVAPSATRYADRSVQPGTSYAYRVRAHNNTQVSEWTNEVNGVTLAAP